jgi:hypothetical protein
MKATRLACGVVAGLVLATGAIADDPPAGEPAQYPPVEQAPAKVDTPAELAAWSAEHRGEIEEIAGAKFAADVPVKVATTEELAERISLSIQRDMLGAVRPDGRPMSAVEIRIRSMAAAFKVATRTFGMYSHEDRVVYVAPENVAKYAKKFGWSAETVERAPRLAVAHEMVHALQDQRADLGERLAHLSGEERAGLTAVSEGQAVWVTDRLARKLDWGAANAVLWGVIAGGRDEEDSAAKAAAAPKIGVAPAGELYALGKKFMESRAEHKGDGPTGAERLWVIVRNPPKTLEELRAPDTSEAKKPGAEDSSASGETRPSGKP